MKAIMKYPGSKWGTAEWIISHFPKHHSYVEPFFGSGGVFFNKPRSDIETINDLDGDVVNLFRWIKNDPEKLAHEIYFTPYSREVYEAAYQKEPEDSLEKAVLFYVRLNMGHGFRTTGEKVGWKADIQGREKAYSAAEWCKIPEKIMEAAERLRGVSPLEKLQQGLGYMEHEDGTRISSVNQVTVGERMKTYVKDGVIWSNVEKTEHSEEWNASRDKEPDNCE